MGFKHATAAHKIQKLSGHATRLVLWDLADLADDKTGFAYIGYKRLMGRCDIASKTTVSLALKELKALGILTWKKRAQNANRYTLSLAKMLELQDEVYKEDEEVEYGDRTSGLEPRETPESPAPMLSTVSVLDGYDDRTSNSTTVGKLSTVSSKLSTETVPFPAVDPSVFPSEKNYACTDTSVLSSSAAQLTSNDKSKTKSKAKATPSDSGTAVPEPQPETHGVSLPQERPRIARPPGTLEEIMARNTAWEAQMAEKKAQYYAEFGDDAL
jgi:hypothetical protein